MLLLEVELGDPVVAWGRRGANCAVEPDCCFAGEVDRSARPPDPFGGCLSVEID
jgi:hypothetical protein